MDRITTIGIDLAKFDPTKTISKFTPLTALAKVFCKKREAGGAAAAAGKTAGLPDWHGGLPGFTGHDTGLRPSAETRLIVRPGGNALRPCSFLAGAAEGLRQFAGLLECLDAVFRRHGHRRPEIGQ